MPLPPPLRGVSGRVSQWGLRVGKAQGKTKTQTLWLLTSVLCTDDLKVWRGRVLCTLCFYCIGYCCLILPVPVLQRLFSFKNAESNLLHAEHLGY